MPKPKQFLKDNKKKSAKGAPQQPTTADEYLAAGVDYEEAGEKWRGGDAAKSTRFFFRAISNYEEALRKFPDSFDLAYNKARVQFELTQYPKLAAQLPVPVIDMLRTALESSRLALRLQQDNADALFNTAQVLSSLAESFSENPGNIKSDADDSLKLLEESIELFQRCLTLQEYRYAEAQAQQTAVESGQPQDQPEESEEMGEEEESSEGESSSDDQWATVIEPITNDTLLDTVLAELEALTVLCGILNGAQKRSLAWIEEFSVPLIKEKLPAYVAGTDRAEEAGLVRANFTAALADAEFRNGLMEASTYQQALSEAFEGLNLSDDPEGLCDKAEALIAYNNAMRLDANVGLEKDILVSRWRALTAALESLTAASKLPSAENLDKIHLTRGDVELLRFQLGQPPFNHEAANRNGPTLLKNAATFYRGSANLAKAAGIVKTNNEATVKEALAQGLGGDLSRLRELIKAHPAAAQEVVQDAIEDGIVALEWLVSTGVAQM